MYIAICSVACSRLFLNLREASRRALYLRWDLSTAPVQTIVIKDKNADLQSDLISGMTEEGLEDSDMYRTLEVCKPHSKSSSFRTVASSPI